MEGGRKAGTCDLFGTNKGSSSSSSSSFSSSSSSSTGGGIFGSVFSTPSSSTILGKESSSSSSVIGSWNTKQQSSGSTKQSYEGQNHNVPNKERSSKYHQEKGEPSYLSSSLYYGGQDVYSSTPSNTQSSQVSHTFKKDGYNDDSNGNDLNSASRGNWWQGSLYY